MPKSTHPHGHIDSAERVRVPTTLQEAIRASYGIIFSFSATVLRSAALGGSFAPNVTPSLPLDDVH